MNFYFKKIRQFYVIFLAKTIPFSNNQESWNLFNVKKIKVFIFKKNTFKIRH